MGRFLLENVDLNFSYLNVSISMLFLFVLARCCLFRFNGFNIFRDLQIPLLSRRVKFKRALPPFLNDN